jgi:hypothetical protein
VNGNRTEHGEPHLGRGGEESSVEFLSIKALDPEVHSKIPGLVDRFWQGLLHRHGMLWNGRRCHYGVWFANEEHVGSVTMGSID